MPYCWKSHVEIEICIFKAYKKHSNLRIFPHVYPPLFLGAVECPGADVSIWFILNNRFIKPNHGRTNDISLGIAKVLLAFASTLVCKTNISICNYDFILHKEPLNMFKPSSDFTDFSNMVFLLWIIFVVYTRICFMFVFVMLSYVLCLTITC